VETNLARVECWGVCSDCSPRKRNCHVGLHGGSDNTRYFIYAAKVLWFFYPSSYIFFSSCPFCSSHGLIFIIFVIYVRSVSFYSFFRSNEIYCQWILRSRFLFRCISKTMTSERERFSRKIAFVPMHYTSRRFSERSHFCSVSLSRYMNVSGREQISRSRTSFSRFPS